MRSMQNQGLWLIRQAESIFRRDARVALREKDFNLALRRAQEVVELTLKGALKILGIDYPKVHDVGLLFSEQLRQRRGINDSQFLGRIEEISLWLAQSRAAAFYFEREFGSEDAERAVEDASFILTEVKRLLAIGGSNKDK